MESQEDKLQDLLKAAAKREKRAYRRATVFTAIPVLVGLVWLSYSTYKIVKLNREIQTLDREIQTKKQILRKLDEKLQGEGSSIITLIGACANGDSPSNEFHDAPAPNGSWDWNCNGQVEREFVPCENLTREQCDPNTNFTGVPPGFCSDLRAEGGCLPKIGECGKPGYVYPCFYKPEDGRCHAGGYERAQAMRCR